MCRCLDKYVGNQDSLQTPGKGAFWNVKKFIMSVGLSQVGCEALCKEGEGLVKKERNFYVHLMDTNRW